LEDHVVNVYEINIMKSVDRIYVAVYSVHVVSCYIHGNENFGPVKKLACCSNGRMTVTTRQIHIRQSDRTVSI
jgi:hypothetical protein